MYNKSTALLLAIFLGWCGGYRFYNGQFFLGIVYLFTCGFFGIGWFIDVLIAFIRLLDTNPDNFPSNIPLTRRGYDLVDTINTKVVGVSYPCALRKDYKRQEALDSLFSGKLILQEYTYEGEPAYYVVIERLKVDIGVLKATLAKKLSKKYEGCIFDISSYKVTGGDERYDEDDDGNEISYTASYGCKIQIDIYKKKEQKESTNTVNK